MRKNLNRLSLVGAVALGAVVLLGASPATAPATKPASTQKSSLVGEKIPSEDPLIKDFHSLGMVQGKLTLFRSASPTRDLVKGQTISDDLAPLQKQADARLKHLADLGIRSIVSLESPDSVEDGGADAKRQQTLWMSLEQKAAQNAGVAYISRPMLNSGPGSMETMSHEEVLKLIAPIAADVLAQSKPGGVLFHCAAGHDRTGMITAYIRMTCQEWPVQQAIDEMRRLGHNWVKYSNNDGISSWHEAHLRAIEDLLKQPKQ